MAAPTTTDWIQAAGATVTAVVTAVVLVANWRMAKAARRQADAAVDALIHPQRPRLELGDPAVTVSGGDVVLRATNVADGQAAVRKAHLQVGARTIEGIAEPRIVARGESLTARFHVRTDAPEYAELMRARSSRAADVDIVVETDNLSGSERQWWKFKLVATDGSPAGWTATQTEGDRRYLSSLPG